MTAPAAATAATAVAPAPVLEVRDLVVRYGSGRKARNAPPAVDGVSFDIAPGETLGVVGESGSGKSTIGKAVLGLQPPTSGTVKLHGQDITTMSLKQRSRLVADLRVVFQDPYSSLNPARTIGQTLVEPLRLMGLKGPEALIKARAGLESVGLPGDAADRYPTQFSGGQRQRIAIARALAMKPELLVLDEPVASLDVSIQAQVLNLFMDLRRDLDLTAIFISHDLGVVRHVSDRVAIMYLGRIVELAPTAELYRDPNHPYTRALFESVPRVGVGRKAFRPIAGEIPSPLHPPSGCHFHPRCPFAGPRCTREAPPLAAIGPGRFSACHLNTGGTA
jgi:oligopeptide/dipeptide ABC transporter ATP-binding protein